MDELDPVLDAEHRRIMGGLDDDEHRTLVALLRRIRETV